MAILDSNNNAYKEYNYSPDEYKCIEDEVLKRVVLYEFIWCDSTSSKEIIQETFMEWLDTKQGQWCRKYAHNIGYVSQHVVETISHSVKIIGYMTEKDYTWFLLNKN